MQIAIAEALGVKFRKDGAPGQFVPDNSIDSFDPQAIMAELGQAELVPYVAPRRGLIIDQGGSA